MRKHYTKYIIFAICLLLLVLYLFGKHEFSVEMLLTFTPRNPLKAAALMLLLYALKSIIIFFPLIVLEIAVGYFFSPWTALGINLVGILIILTIPYLIGRAVGLNAIQKLIQKYPRFGEILGKQQNNELFLCFFLKIISCLPGDLVTMYFGATQTPFWKNLFGGIIGVLPGMILATFMGSNIQDPSSPAFWISIILTIALAALSFFLYHAYRRKMKK